MTIYLPDELFEKVKAHEDLNVSAVCQEALREELSWREAAAKFGEGMKRHTLFDEARERDVSFIGKRIYTHDTHPFRDDEVYLTAKHALAVYQDHEQRLHVYDDFDALKREFAGSSEEAEFFLAGVAQELGEKYVVFLDI